MIRKILIIILYCLIGATSASGVESAGSFLDIGGGAQPMALGNAYGASKGELWESYFNPAGIYGMTVPFLGSTYQTMFVDTNIKTVGMGIPLSFATVAAHYFTAGVNSIPETILDENDRPGETGNSFSYIASVMTFTIAKELYNNDLSTIAAGLNLRYIEEQLWTRSAHGIGVDIGAVYAYAGRYRFGVSLVNFISPEMSWNTGTGTRERIPLRLITGFQYNSADDRVMIKASLERKNYNQQLWHLGVQYTLMKGFAIRAGVNDGQISTGAGLSIGSVDLDYALFFARDEEIGTVHRVSLGLKMPAPCSVTASVAQSLPKTEVPVKVVTVTESAEPEADNYEITLQTAHRAFILEQYEEAKELYLQVLTIRENETVALNKLGDVYAALDDYDLALRYWNRALSLEPDSQSLKQKIANRQEMNSAEMFYNKGYTSFCEGDYEAACRFYQKALESDPEYVKAYLWLGNSYMRLGKKELARQAWSRGGEDVKQEAERFYTMGYISLQQEAYDQAVSNYERAIELDPRNEQAYLWLGLVHIRRNSIDSALDAWNRGIQQCPDSTRIRDKLSTHRHPDSPQKLEDE